jgi:hypothetical protein
MSSAGRRAISLQPSRHFGFITPSPKGIRNYFATHDLTIDPNLERLFALTMNATTVEIPSSHVVMFLHPFEVAAVIRKAAAVGGEQP